MKLAEIQAKLKAPKSQYNAFGKYKYRNCEDILEAVKPLLGDSVLTLSDEVKTTETIMPESLFEGSEKLAKSVTFKTQTISYIEATATFNDGDNTTIVKAQAGIVDKKGMDIAQSFGAASSYARKYALNGLFLIDDTKDADTTNDHGAPETMSYSKPDNPSKPYQNARLNPISPAQKKMLEAEISKRGIDREKFKQVFGLKSLSSMPAGTFQEALEKARKKPLLQEAK